MQSLFGDEPDEDETALPTSALVSMLRYNLGAAVPGASRPQKQRRASSDGQLFQAEGEELEENATVSNLLFQEERDESSSGLELEVTAHAAAASSSLYQDEPDEDSDSDSATSMAPPPAAAEVELFCSLGWETLGLASFNQLLGKGQRAKSEADAKQKKRKYDGSRRQAKAAARKAQSEAADSSRPRRGDPVSCPGFKKCVFVCVCVGGGPGACGARFSFGLSLSCEIKGHLVLNCI